VPQHCEGWHWRRLYIYWVAAPLARPLHYIQFPFTFLLYPLFELLTAIAHVCPDQLQPITYLVGCSKYEECSLAIHYVCRVDDRAHHKTRCINENVAFSAADLRPVVAVRPPFSVVFTDCESMTAAEG
jgi:hypothetical protein